MKKKHAAAVETVHRVCMGEDPYQCAKSGQVSYHLWVLKEEAEVVDVPKKKGKVELTDGLGNLLEATVLASATGPRGGLDAVIRKISGSATNLNGGVRCTVDVLAKKFETRASESGKDWWGWALIQFHAEEVTVAEEALEAKTDDNPSESGAAQ